MPSIHQLPLGFVFSKRCTCCKELLPAAEFHIRHGARRVAFDSYCKSCKLAWARRRYSRDSEFRASRASYSRQVKYGLTHDQFVAMLEAQGGVCAICHELPTSKKGFAVDHDHATGKVRGLLCSHCNSGMGGLRDSADLLRAAADYLDAHK